MSAKALWDLLFSIFTIHPRPVRFVDTHNFSGVTAFAIKSVTPRKMRAKHIVPLSRQAVEILQELHPHTGNGRFLFPSIRTNSKPISLESMLVAIRAMGFTKDEMTIHGFRGLASTLLNEMGYNRDWVERQLAHSERDHVRAAYNYAQYLPERTRMMQEWSDYLDELRADSPIVQ